jgi:8-oxo-dGTP pyrophosphatase MutT (NUDIX family)
MAQRGGQQRIPRPPGVRPGSPPPWAHVDRALRRFTLAEVIDVCAKLPRPARPETPAGSRAAAALMPIFEEGGEARVVLTKRPDTMPSHRGEIAFPGGKHEPEVDAGLEAAALREAHEEIGLDPAAVTVAAELESLATVAGAFVLTPFVGLVHDGRPALRPDPVEVVSVFDVALSELLEDGTFHEERWDIPPGLGTGAGPDRVIHFYELDTETVWGATARILTSFLAHLTDLR